MRIITWNCNNAFHRKMDALLSLEPDIAVIQECEQSYMPPDGYAHTWCGENPRKGLAVISRVSELHLDPPRPRNWVYFLPVDLPDVSLRLLATWAFNHRTKKLGPEFSGNPLTALEGLEGWLREGPAIMAGDFNNNAIWNYKNSPAKFSLITERLASLGFQSAYHQMTGEPFGEESQGTLFHTKDPEKPYHIDYCFVNGSIHVRRVNVEQFENWRAHSDHVPVIVDLSVDVQ